MLAQIAQALAAVHAAGIVHRDVKASNVLLTPDGTAKLTDFGIARTGAGGYSHKETLVGTPAYMAPEGPVDARSDLYSLGVVYYEILCGDLPFVSSSYQEVILAHIRKQPDLTRLPPSEREIAGWLLDKDPLARAQSADQLMARLQAVPRQSRPSAIDHPPAAGTTTHAAGPSLARTSREPERPDRQAAFAALAMGVFAVLVLTAVVVLAANSAPGTSAATPPAQSVGSVETADPYGVAPIAAGFVLVGAAATAATMALAMWRRSA
jgi:eukaryotic-like serine/threonine-protein kinase